MDGPPISRPPQPSNFGALGAAGSCSCPICPPCFVPDSASILKLVSTGTNSLTSDNDINTSIDVDRLSDQQLGALVESYNIGGSHDNYEFVESWINGTGPMGQATKLRDVIAQLAAGGKANLIGAEDVPSLDEQANQFLQSSSDLSGAELARLANSYIARAREALGSTELSKVWNYYKHGPDGNPNEPALRILRQYQKQITSQLELAMKHDFMQVHHDGCGILPPDIANMVFEQAIFKIFGNTANNLFDNNYYATNFMKYTKINDPNIEKRFNQLQKNAIDVKLVEMGDNRNSTAVGLYEQVQQAITDKCTRLGIDSASKSNRERVKTLLYHEKSREAQRLFYSHELKMRDKSYATDAKQDDAAYELLAAQIMANLYAPEAAFSRATFDHVVTDIQGNAATHGIGRVFSRTQSDVELELSAYENMIDFKHALIEKAGVGVAITDEHFYAVAAEKTKYLDRIIDDIHWLNRRNPNLYPLGSELGELVEIATSLQGIIFGVYPMRDKDVASIIDNFKPQMADNSYLSPGRSLSEVGGSDDDAERTLSGASTVTRARRGSIIPTSEERAGSAVDMSFKINHLISAMSAHLETRRLSS